jgi:hypothetical protein
MLKVKLDTPLDLEDIRVSRMIKFKQLNDAYIARYIDDPYEGGGSDDEVEDSKVDEWNAKYPHRQYAYQKKKKDTHIASTRMADVDDDEAADVDDDEAELAAALVMSIDEAQGTAGI